MQTYRLLLALFLLSPAVIAQEPTPQISKPLVFTAVGCGPYKPADLPVAKHYIARENALRTSDFIIHLGDICTGKAAREGTLTEKTYSDTKAWLTTGSTIPTYIVPGDNEWNDRKDPEVGWEHWSKHLMRLEENSTPAWKTSRQKVREENFAFVHQDVLVIGINLVGGRIHDREEWSRRFRENNDWIEKQFEAHSDDVGAAIICAQANIVGQGKVAPAVNVLFTPFRSRFGKLAKAFDKPVLFLHSDGHTWVRDQPWKDAPNITRIQIDLLNAKFPPLQITVDPTAEEVFKTDRRLKQAGWKLKLPDKADK